jgi:hypothetical protein
VTDQTLRAAAERQARAPEPPTLGQSRDAKLAEDVRPVGVGGGEECVGIGLGEGLARVEAVHEGERAKPEGEPIVQGPHQSGPVVEAASYFRLVKHSIDDVSMQPRAVSVEEEVGGLGCRLVLHHRFPPRVGPGAICPEPVRFPLVS